MLASGHPPDNWEELLQACSSGRALKKSKSTDTRWLQRKATAVPTPGSSPMAISSPALCTLLVAIEKIQTDPS
jgi:hypothetical protein